MSMGSQETYGSERDALARKTLYPMGGGTYRMIRGKRE